MALTKNPYGKCDKTFFKHVLLFCITVWTFTKKHRRFHNTNLNLFHCGKLISIMALTLFCGLYIPGLLSHNYTIICANLCDCIMHNHLCNLYSLSFPKRSINFKGSSTAAKKASIPRQFLKTCKVFQGKTMIGMDWNECFFLLQSHCGVIVSMSNSS